MNKLGIILILISACQTLGWTQPDDIQLVQKTNNHHVGFHWANDILNQTDYYYSNGFELSYSNKSFTNLVLNKLLLPSNMKGLTDAGLEFKHHIFTPIHKSDTLDEGDRPFASYWMLSYHHSTRNPDKKWVLKSGLGIGLMGKYAFGKEVQNGFHSMLANSEDVPGWDTQIKTSALVNYFGLFEKGLIESEHFQLNTMAQLRLGLPYTDLSMGAKMQIGIFDPYFENNSRTYSNKFQMYVTLSPGIRMVGYNATLQGGINKSNQEYVLEEINHVVPEAELRLTVQYKNYTLFIGQNYISKEFKTARDHQWGYLSLNVSF